MRCNMNNLFFLGLVTNACENVDILRVCYFIKQLLKIAFIILPIVLIVMLSIDFAKNVVSQEDEMKKNLQLAIKRLLYAVAVFLVPTIVNIAINVIGDFDIGYKKCLNVTLDKIDDQIIINKNKCIEDGYKWDTDTKQCQITSPTANRKDIELSQGMKLIKNSSSTKNDGGFIYYNQGDYKSVKFCSGSKTVAGSGCGATSFAVVASSLVDKKYDPKAVANWLCKNGHGGGGLSASWFTNKTFLNQFKLSSKKLFDNGNYQGNSGKSYKKSQGEKILDAVKSGKGVVLYIPGHYVAVGPNKECTANQVYLYDVGNRMLNGCYNTKTLFAQTKNNKNRCLADGNCGWKAAWAFTAK